jgi:hypothetical protein
LAQAAEWLLCKLCKHETLSSNPNPTKKKKEEEKEEEEEEEEEIIIIRADRMAQVTKHLPSKHKALSSNPT